MKRSPIITKTSIRLAIGSLFLACLMAGAQDKDSYTKAELQKEQNLFITYLRAATNELSVAKVRLFDKSECRLAALATVQSLTQLDSSRISQDGHLERIAKVASSGLLTANYNSKSLNESYLPIRNFGDDVENQVNDFLKSFERTCPDWMWVIKQYQEAAQKIRQNAKNRAEALSGLHQIYTDLKNGGENGPVSFGANDTTGVFILSPTAENRAKFVADMTSKGLSQDDAGALADAVQAKNCDAIRQILSKYPSQQSLLQRLMSTFNCPASGSTPRPTSEFPGGAGAKDVKNLQDNPTDPAAKEAFIKSAVAHDISPDDAAALADAIAKKDCASSMRILAKYAGNAYADQQKHQLEATDCPPGSYQTASTSSSTSGPTSGSTSGSTATQTSSVGGETDQSDWGDFENGKRYRAVADYPSGKADGTLSAEHWEIQDQTNPQATEKQEHPWELRIKAAGDRPAKNQDSFTVDNEQKSSNPESFVIDEWKLMKGDSIVQTGAGATFVAAYSEGGEYQIVATGHTEPGVKLKKFGFTVRKSRRYNP